MTALTENVHIAILVSVSTFFFDYFFNLYNFASLILLAADILRPAVFLRALFFCACVEDDKISRLGAMGIRLLLQVNLHHLHIVPVSFFFFWIPIIVIPSIQALRTKSLTKLHSKMYELLDGKLLIFCAQESVRLFLSVESS
jgi:hypothetical protein